MSNDYDVSMSVTIGLDEVAVPSTQHTGEPSDPASAVLSCAGQGDGLDAGPSGVVPDGVPVQERRVATAPTYRRSLFRR